MRCSDRISRVMLCALIVGLCAGGVAAIEPALSELRAVESGLTQTLSGWGFSPQAINRFLRAAPSWTPGSWPAGLEERLTRAGASAEEQDALLRELTRYQALRGGSDAPLGGFCGDCFVDPPEQCDDCNTLPGDGCSPGCTIEPVCGDCVVQPPEQCDDCDTLPGDGCSPTCMVETAVCGDCFIQPPEQCDDCNTFPGDGCSPGCTIEPVCGDCIVQPPEQCDDCDTLPGDGCSPTCTVETAVCGDCVVQPPEQCDDCNTFPGDGCSPGCTIEPVCGDCIVQPPEQCDDCDTLPGDGCSPTCTVETAVCGDCVVQPPEQCDDCNTFPGDGCSPGCTIEPVCGDCIVQPPEQCDDCDTLPGDGCSPTCTVESAVCGDCVIQPPEQCDDCDTLPGDGCSPTCMVETAGCGDCIIQPPEQCDDCNTFPGDGCSPACTTEVACGDSFPQTGEECDDGNTTSGDGCSATCTLEIDDSDITDAFFSDDPDVSCAQYLTGVSVSPIHPALLQIKTTYGAATFPTNGPDFLVLSSGDPDAPSQDGDLDVSPAGACEVDNVQVTFTFDFPDNGSGDSVVQALSFNFDFFSYEYPEFVGSEFNDYVFAYLDSAPVALDAECNAPLTPPEGCLITRDALGNPTNVNNAFFLGCDVVGCDSPPGTPGWHTEFEEQPGDDAGRTRTLTTCTPTSCSAPVTSGVHTLTLLVGDAGDGIYTAAGLFDNLRCFADLECEDPVTGQCGDGILGFGEECDDNNTVSGDGCSASCTIENTLCGNGTIDLPEQCDDGNPTPHDGCTVCFDAPGRVPPTILLGKPATFPDDITIFWEPSCRVAAQDYGIYEGTLGTWYDHSRIDCLDDLADLQEDVPTPADSTYYLVVPHNGGVEGSYGASSLLPQRPVGTLRCAPAQDYSACP